MSRRTCDASSNSSILESTGGAYSLHSVKQEREVRKVKGLQEKLKSAFRWLVKHVKITSRDLNELERGEHDDNRKPKSAMEVKLKWEF